MNFDNLLGVVTKTLNKRWDIDENYVYDFVKGEIISRWYMRAIKRKDKAGYIYFHNKNYNGKNTLGHRILFCKYHDIDYEQLPRHLKIDHINMEKNDNQIVNLRLLTHKMNHGNRPQNKNNASGFKGVFWHKKAKKWYAQIGHNKKVISLGLYACPEQARQAYNRKAKELNERENACYRLS